jgi:hypothetical protein
MNANGRSPLRDPESTTYLGSFAALDEFGLAVLEAARHRGLARAHVLIYRAKHYFIAARP